MSCNVAFIGLGVMGYPMAGYISKGGHNVTVFNRTKSKAEKWIKEYKGNMANTPAEAAKDAEYIFTCVGNDNDLREVTLGDKGLFKTAKKGSIYIDNTTASANIARELYKQAKSRGFDFLDAPISGGQAGAEGGTLTVMVGGDEAPFKKAEHYMVWFVNGRIYFTSFYNLSHVFILLENSLARYSFTYHNFTTYYNIQMYPNY